MIAWMARFAIGVWVISLPIGCLQAGLENSVVPLVEYYEEIQNLPPAKFTKRQMSEIQVANERKDEKIRVVTYNMLFDLYDHLLPQEYRWDQRAPRIVALINHMQPDIICTQELYPVQAQMMETLLAKDFAFFEGYIAAKGESYGIFYRKSRFEIRDSQVMDHLSFIELTDVITGKQMCVFNTHLAFADIEQREAEVLSITQKVRPYAREQAVVFTGDLNCFPARLELSRLPFYDGDHLARIISSASLTDAYAVSLLGHFGPISTFTNQGEEIDPFQGTGTPGVMLDHVYVSDRITVLAHATEPSTLEGYFPSDHMPVIVDVLID